MSEAYENQKTLRQLRSQIEDLKPVDGEKFYFITKFYNLIIKIFKYNKNDMIAISKKLTYF